MLLGLTGDATYSNYQEANRAFYRLTVVPLVSRVMGSVSQWLSGLAGGWWLGCALIWIRCRPSRKNAISNGPALGLRLF